MRTLAYPLVITTFSEKECTEIMKPVLQAALSRSGIVRSLPRILIYSPRVCFGLELPNLYASHGFDKLERLVKYGISANDETGNLIRFNMEMAKLELGTNGPLCTNDFEIWGPLASPTWLSFLWKFLWTTRITL